MSAAKPPRALTTAGWVDAATLPKGPNGRPLCRYCGQEITNRRKRTFCSGRRTGWGKDPATGGRMAILQGHGCVHEHLIRSDPGYARLSVEARDGRVCAACGRVADEGDWQADHIVPVAEGGGSCGLDNLRTLCTGCHKAATAELAARLARARREAAAADSPQLSMLAGSEA